ncbi:NUDIX domain-containing protein [Corynebacterium sp. zg254]|uniref:NUDIX domain-containing protein n=1 Tax=Corynebacterium zhongnanshanii TaxID=2768834 RepID=A0ABQ6VGB8_9CORY|nr:MULTISPECIES: NUDIX hydrolase [Corynebacterium]KAB3523239.1 NUDIX domain-containing protein [Corynebacterium zhongnanshanii]MCR5913645.1 NUDIX domain-containing protein [Corynebacterium sp. zg254]
MHTGDGWAVAADGSRMWGTLGAAGLCLFSPDNRVLMQHRSVLTAQGGTWALPGGAIEVGESAVEGALRENHEETGIDPALITVMGSVVTTRREVAYALARRPVLPEDEPLLAEAHPSNAWLERNPIVHPEHGSHLIYGLGEQYWWEYQDTSVTEWSYTTVLGRAPSELSVATTWESDELRWVPWNNVEDLPLMPAFAASLPQLRAALRELDHNTNEAPNRDAD